MVVTILSGVAQAERQGIPERTNEGRLDARVKGVKFGRKPSINRNRLMEFHEARVGATDIAWQIKIWPSTVKYWEKFNFFPYPSFFWGLLQSPLNRMPLLCLKPINSVLVQYQAIGLSKVSESAVKHLREKEAA